MGRIGRPPAPVRERFEKFVESADNSCHEWQGTLHKFGYGKFWYRHAQQSAHRVSWELYRGEIPKGACVLHKCDNPKCVNPDHLYLGSYKDNALDRENRKRNWGFRRVTDEQARKILTLLKVPELQQKDIAALMGVSDGTVSLIKLGKRDYAERLKREM